MAGFASRADGSSNDDGSEKSTPSKESRKPGNSDFKQQRLKAWQPILTASSVLPVFFFIGVVFVPIGIGLLVTSNKVKEKTIDYTDCNGCDKTLVTEKNFTKPCYCTLKFKLDTAFDSKVYLYYGLSNFYQNHRRYVRSRDDSQLHGDLKMKVAGDCSPFDKANVMVNNQSVSKPVAPCGAIANSLFNDTFVLYQINSTKQRTHIPLSGKNIAWKSDVNDKFKNPSGNIVEKLKPFAKPSFWQKSIAEIEGYFKNEAFIVWMRVAAFPTFRKLHKIKEGGLSAGEYEIDVTYNYPVSAFKGEKRVILSTSTWIGGKNPFLGIAYIVVGCICIICGAVFLFVHLKVRTRALKNL
ncbi:cell cycle control protein 50A-like [Rhopilema esculentum]|uniref:cell cycle control protein 50A-like n=1 Tax=Rhopilema esculentum TaxID=499914 RepID=UPI0031D9935D